LGKEPDNAVAEKRAMSRRNIQTAIMPKKPNHEADIKNPNKGNDGTNAAHAKAHGNRGKQLNPNQKGKA